MIWYAAPTPPEGFIECNGQSTAAYPVLAAIVGATVPDLRGEFIRGWAHDRTGIPDVGRSFGSWQTDSTKVFLDGGSSYDSNGKNDRNYGISAWDGTVLQFDAIRISIPGGSKRADLQLAMHSIYGAAPETRGRNLSLLPCIKY